MWVVSRDQLDHHLADPPARPHRQQQGSFFTLAARWTGSNNNLLNLCLTMNSQSLLSLWHNIDNGLDNLLWPQMLRCMITCSSLWPWIRPCILVAWPLWSSSLSLGCMHSFLLHLALVDSLITKQLESLFIWFPHAILVDHAKMISQLFLSLGEGTHATEHHSH